MLLAEVGWPDVAVALITALPGLIAAVAALHVRRAIQTPSGDRIGAIAERTEHLSAADVALTTKVVKHLNGEKGASDG